MRVRARHTAERTEQVATGSLEDMRATVVPGTGVVARLPGIVLVAPDSGDPRVTDLLGICRSLTDEHREAPGPTLTRRIVRWLTSLDDADGELPEFGVAAVSPRGLVVFLCGRVRATLSGPVEQEETCMSGEDASTWLDRVVPWPVGPLALLSSAGESSAGDRYGATSGAAGLGVPWSDLGAGVVPGAGLVLHPASGRDRAVLQPRQDSAPLPEPDPDGGPATSRRPIVEPISGRSESNGQALPLPRQLDETWSPQTPQGDEPDEPRPPAVVMGVVCAREHFNDPRAAFCVMCGIRMDQRSGPLVAGERPPLGLLVLGDGSRVVLDGDYVLGREPGQHEAVRSGSARPLPLDDDSGTLSRAHAEIRVHDWDVLVADCDSVNGTYVAPRDATEWSRVMRDEPERLVQGMRIQVGECVLLYESPHGLR